MSKKMTGGLLKNKGILYMFLIFALIDVYALLYQKDIKTLMIFVLASFITAYYTKNMTIILIIGLVVSNIFKTLTYTEGFTVDFQGAESMDSADHVNDLGGAQQERMEEAFQNEGDADDDDDDDIEDADDADVEEDPADTPAISQDQVKDAKELAKTQKALLKNLKDMQPLLKQAEGFANKYGNQISDEKISKLIKALDAKQK